MNKWFIVALAAAIAAAAVVITISMGSIGFTDLLNKGIHEKSAGDLKAAKKAINEAIEMKPDSAEAHYFLGSIYLAEKDGDKAKKELDKAIELDDSEAKYYVELSFVYFNLMAEEEKAIKAMEKAIELDPDDYQYRVTLGVYLEKGDKKEKAIKQFEKAIELEPSMQGIQERLIILYKETGDLDKAKELAGEPESTSTKAGSSFIESEGNAY